jgi:hypothetical protein
MSHPMTEANGTRAKCRQSPKRNVCGQALGYYNVLANQIDAIGLRTDFCKICVRKAPSTIEAHTATRNYATRERAMTAYAKQEAQSV